MERKKTPWGLWLLILLLLAVGAGLGGSMLVRIDALTESGRQQQLQIAELTRQAEQLQEQLAQRNRQLELQESDLARLRELVPGEGFAESCTTAGYDYLAIGNSVTIHDICDYWWSEAGMAASAPEKDYVNIVAAKLAEEGKQVNFRPYSFYTWEAQHTDRSEALTLLERELCSAVDLVSIQLSENVFDLTTFAQDFRALVTYVKEHAPQARIVVIGDIWSAEKNAIKQQICREEQVSFVDLTPILGKDAYLAKLGTQVSGADGQMHTIAHPGVAEHPGDLGMAYIANGILAELRNEK